MSSFVYCWTDHLTNKLYIGSHKGTTDDSYICSSKYMMEEYNKRPQDFTRQILAEGKHNEMLVLESKLLKSVDAANNSDYYNQSNGDNKFYCKKHNVRTKKLLSDLKRGLPSAFKGKRHSPESREKMKRNHADFSGKNHHLFGRKVSEETRRKISESKLKYHSKIKSNL